LMEGISRAFVMQDVLGLSFGHSETRAFIERLIGQIERPRKTRKRLRNERTPMHTRVA
jgi:hypothetical protein